MKAVASLHSLRQIASGVWSSIISRIQKIDAFWIIIWLSVLIAAIATLLYGHPIGVGLTFIVIVTCTCSATYALMAIKSGTLTIYFVVWVMACLLMAFFILDITVALILLHQTIDASIANLNAP